MPSPVAAPIFERIADRATLAAAFRRVRRNKGGAGGDGETLAAFALRLDDSLARLSGELVGGHYRPRRLRYWQIPKPNGKMRRLAVPSVRDRVVQAATAVVLSGLYDAGMSRASFAYRPGLSVEHAAGLVTVHRLRGFTQVVDGDIAGFFDNVPHAAVFDALAELRCPRTLDLVAAWLAGFSAEGRGLAQGSPLSPFLANLVLSPIDRAIETRRIKLVRYADDFLLMARTRQEAEGALTRMADLLAPLGLALNAEKTRVAGLDDGIRFLGLHFAGASVVREG